MEEQFFFGALTAFASYLTFQEIVDEDYFVASIYAIASLSTFPGIFRGMKSTKESKKEMKSLEEKLSKYNSS